MKSTDDINLGSIGVFDSGYGGLTVLSEFQKHLPEYNYIYLGDNSRAPYGSRSFDIVYEFTRQAVFKLFDMGCNLVILACNTASAKALRTIQQNDLPHLDSCKRVLGVIRPTAEIVGKLTHTKHIGVVGTQGTIQSQSYQLEIQKLYPELDVVGEACPMWVPLIENNEFESEGADYFIKKNLDNLFERDSMIDTLILGCTHYPLLKNKIDQFVPSGVQVVSQGEIVAKSLKDYLLRHPEMDSMLAKNAQTEYYTTEAVDKFADAVSLFLGKDVAQVQRINLE